MRGFIFAALCVLFAAATYEIQIAPSETLTLGDISITAEACPECPPQVQPPPVEPPVTPPPPVIEPPTNTITIPLGMNLPGPDEWNMGARAKLFVDVMKTAREIAPKKWRVLTTSNNKEPSLNWSTSGSRQPEIRGTYLLSWDGGGTVAASGATVKNATTSTADIVIASNDVDIDLTFSTAAKNIRLIRPGYSRSTTQIVTKEFKRFAAPFDTIRFMDAMVTNWADAADATERYKSLGADKKLDWNERAPDGGTYNRPWGLSIESTIAICNETKTNPWIPIPWCSTDDYITGLAVTLARDLDPSLVIYVEWGNELWNYAGGFYHSTLFKNEAVANVEVAKLRMTADDNDWYFAQRYAMKRLIDASEILRAHLGSRVKPIYSSQFANPSFAGDALNWALRTYPKRPSEYISGIACAPYIGTSTGTVDEMIAKLRADIATRKTTESRLMNWRAMADAYQIDLYMYEAGIDVGQGTGNLANRIALGYAPAMDGVIKSYLDNCYIDAGTENLMYFNGVCTRDKWGIWGLTDDISDLQQPMYRGAATFVAAPKPDSGFTATFFRKPDFTEPLGTITVPVINHRWQAWSTGAIWGRKDLVSTQVVDGSIRFEGRYTGSGTPRVECEANDSATLTRNGDMLRIDYVARFGGNGIAWVRFMP